MLLAALRDEVSVARLIVAGGALALSPQPVAQLSGPVVDDAACRDGSPDKRPAGARCDLAAELLGTPVAAISRPGVVLVELVNAGTNSGGAATCVPMLVQPLSLGIRSKPEDPFRPKAGPDSVDSASQFGAVVAGEPAHGGGATPPRVRELAVAAGGDVIAPNGLLTWGAGFPPTPNDCSAAVRRWLPVD
jgi:hypothetical protein